MLAVAVHSLVNRKYLAHFLMIVYFIAVSFSGLLGYEHNLYKYAANGDFTYSDMNGFGPFLVRVRFFQAYWAAAALLLAVAAYLFWQRGTASGWRERRHAAWMRFTRPVRAVTAVAVVAMAGLGGVIYDNTNVLNPYLTAYDGEARQAEYEKRYKTLAGKPQPKITAVSVAVDLYPAEQRVRMRGRYRLENRTVQPIDAVHLTFLARERLVIDALAFSVASMLVTDDMKTGLRSYRLASPLSPGGRVDLDFDLEVPTHGFTNAGATTDVVGNGSFVNGQAVLPMIGYQERGKLVTDGERRKFGLEAQGADANARRSDRPRAERIGRPMPTSSLSMRRSARTRTSGRLRRATWNANGFATAATISPIAWMRRSSTSSPSSRRAMRSRRIAGTTWRSRSTTRRGHEYNLARMTDVTRGRSRLLHRRTSARISTASSGSSSFRAMRRSRSHSRIRCLIRRASASSLACATTPRDIDYPYYVTAHELAHQWWGHQVPGAERAGRHDAGRDARAVLGADGDEEEVRRGEDAAGSCATSSTVT